jgi:hypothetical protein
VVRRLPHVVAIAAIALLLFPTAAAPPYSLAVENPGNGTVSRALDVKVRVNSDLTDPRVTGLRVRLASGGDPVEATCVDACGERGPVFSFPLDPRAGAPFADGPLPNGRTAFEAIVSRELGDDQRLAFDLNLRVPGSAVGGLAATIEDRKVRLAWRRAPEPDIERYRVERCGGVCGDESGSWEALRETQPSASSFTDEPGDGEFSYRVVTIRSTGGDGALETVSSPVVAEVVAVANGNGDGSGGDGNGDEADGNGNGGNGNGDGADDRPQRPERPRSESRERPRSGSAPSISSGERGAPRESAGVPEVADAFEPELDYSGMDARLRGGDGGSTPDDTDIDDEVIVGAPRDGDGTFFGALTDPDRVAVPIAGGLLLTAVGLHLWRWLKIPIP